MAGRRQGHQSLQRLALLGCRAAGACALMTLLWPGGRRAAPYSSVSLQAAGFGRSGRPSHREYTP
eukprot:2300015-Heterocapsa_arctica.AAC.1